MFDKILCVLDLPMRTLCDTYHKEFESHAFNLGHIWSPDAPVLPEGTTGIDLYVQIIQFSAIMLQQRRQI